MNDTDQRRTFRVREPVYLKYEVLSDLDFHEGLERRRLRRGLGASVASTLAELDARLGAELQRMQGDASPTARCLSLLNEKLDVFLNQMPALRKARADLANSRSRMCDISADGIVFATPQPIPVGTRLYVELLFSDNRFVDAFGTVVRETAPPDGEDDDYKFGVAVEFHGMKPELRETLIQHMFSRESETLRMRRLELESR